MGRWSVSVAINEFLVMLLAIAVAVGALLIVIYAIKRKRALSKED